MSDKRYNLELAPLANLPTHSPHNYSEPPQYGGNGGGSESPFARLREWRRIIYRHKWLILSFILIALPLATIQAYRAKPIYQATTTIEIGAETSSLSKAGDVIIVGSNDNTKAETVIIKSLPVIRQTITSLNLDKNPNFLDVTTKRSVLEALTALKGSQPEREKKLAREAAKQNDDNANAGEMKTAAPGKAAGPERDRSVADHAEITPNAEAERKRMEPYIQTLLDNLSVDGLRDTRLIKISFRHTDPDIAAAVADGVASSFMSYNFQAKTSRFITASKWLEDTTRKLRAQVEQAEQKLVNYSKENDIFSLEGKENLTVEKMAQMHDRVLRAETDRILKQSLYEEVKQGRGAQLPEAYSDPKTADLRKKLNELAVEASQLSVKFGAKNPRLQEIQKQMATLQEQIKGSQSMLEDRLKADYERAVKDEANLTTELEGAKGEAVLQNQAAIQYSVLRQ